MTQDSDQTTFLHVSPVLASSSVQRDVDWYTEKLGFTNVYDSTRYQDGPMDYAVIGRQGLYLHLQFQYPKDMVSTDVKFEVKNIDPLITEFVEKGILRMDKVHKKTPWNTTEFGIKDPSGNRITFLEDL